MRATCRDSGGRVVASPISCSNASLAEIDPPVLRHLTRLGRDTANADEFDCSHWTPGLGQRNEESVPNRFGDPSRAHVRIQAAFQKHVDNAISKTVNLPTVASPRDAVAAYLLAYRLGCKGVAVFRCGSKSEPMLELGLCETPEERGHFTRCDPQACRL